jgi:hypothetical protein
MDHSVVTDRPHDVVHVDFVYGRFNTYVTPLLLTVKQIGILHLPLQFVWLSSLFFLIGGGPVVGTTMITTIVADVAPPEKR